MDVLDTMVSQWFYLSAYRCISLQLILVYISHAKARCSKQILPLDYSYQKD